MSSLSRGHAFLPPVPAAHTPSPQGPLEVHSLSTNVLPPVDLAALAPSRVFPTRMSVDAPDPKAVLPDDVWHVIVAFVRARDLPCARTTARALRRGADELPTLPQLEMTAAIVPGGAQALWRRLDVLRTDRSAVAGEIADRAKAWVGQHDLVPCASLARIYPFV